MSSLAKIQRNFQITIPADIRKKARIKVGDLVDFEVTENGIIIKPQETIDRNQTWFWSDKWQSEEKKVEDDFSKGNILESKNVESFLNELDE